MSPPRWHLYSITAIAQYLHAGQITASQKECEVTKKKRMGIQNKHKCPCCFWFTWRSVIIPQSPSSWWENKGRPGWQTKTGVFCVSGGALWRTKWSITLNCFEIDGWSWWQKSIQFHGSKYPEFTGRLLGTWAKAGPWLGILQISAPSCLGWKGSGSGLRLPGASWGVSIRASQAWNQSLTAIKGRPAPPLWLNHLGLSALSTFISMNYIRLLAHICLRKWVESNGVKVVKAYLFSQNHSQEGKDGSHQYPSQKLLTAINRHACPARPHLLYQFSQVGGLFCLWPRLVWSPELRPVLTPEGGEEQRGEERSGAMLCAWRAYAIGGQ